MNQELQLTHKIKMNNCLSESDSFEVETKDFKKSVIKKLLISMVLSFATFTVINAQMKFGVSLGVNASTQSEIGNICDNNALKAGFNAGVLAKYNFSDWMAVKSGIGLQGKGKKCDSNELKTEITDNLQYLVLPVKAEFSAGEKAGFKNENRLFFATGPYFGYLLNAKQTINNNTTDLTGLNDFDYGWSFELGFEFPVFKANSLQVSVNYDMGITEIALDTDMQNKTASFNVGFAF